MNDMFFRGDAQRTEQRQDSVLQRLSKGRTDMDRDSFSPEGVRTEIKKLRKQGIPKPRKSNPATDGDFSRTGLAERFNENKDYAFNRVLGWLHWDGARWQQVESTAVSQDIVQWSTRSLIQAIEDRDSAAESAFYAVRNGDVVRVLAMLESSAFVPHTLFVDEPWKLNCRNGIVDLKTGAITSHCKSYSLNQCNTSYNPNAEMTEWEKFIADVLPDPDVAHYVKVMFGYALSGCVEEEMFSIFYGGGKNGKSTLCNIVSSVIGSYSGELPTSSLAIKKNEQDNSPHFACQIGKRLIFSNEPPDGMVLNDSAIKTLGSRDRMKVCAKYKDPFDLKPSWLLVLRCNNKPNIRAIDDGIWRRVKEIPFTVRFDKPDRSIEQRMIDDHSEAVLKWIVEGAMEYSKSRLPECSTIDRAIQQYRREQDSIEGWFSECVIADPKAHTELSKLSSSYLDWCSKNGAYEHSLKRLSDSFDKRGYSRVSGTRMVTYVGVRV